MIVVLRHLEHNTEILIKLMQHMECRVTDEELRAIIADHEIGEKLEQGVPTPTKIIGSRVTA